MKWSRELLFITPYEIFIFLPISRKHESDVRKRVESPPRSVKKIFQTPPLYERAFNGVHYIIPLVPYSKST